MTKLESLGIKYILQVIVIIRFHVRSLLKENITPDEKRATHEELLKLLNPLIGELKKILGEEDNESNNENSH